MHTFPITDIRCNKISYINDEKFSLKKIEKYRFRLLKRFIEFILRR